MSFLGDCNTLGASEAKLSDDFSTLLVGTICVRTSIKNGLQDLFSLLFLQGASFAHICKMTDVFEGSVIRCMRRLEELLRQMCQASKAIGNTELENKFAEG